MSKKNIIVVGLWLSVLWLQACTENKKSSALDEETQEQLLKKGSEIAGKAQQVLLSNVSEAIKREGVPRAVAFCNLNAAQLTDSMGKNLDISSITRLSDKNRNQKNALHKDLDQKAWEIIQTKMQDANTKEKNTILQDKNQVYYYQAIAIGMPTCLSCHGSKESEITIETQKILNEKYPQDKAFGYKMGDLRGMWKINLSTNG